MANTYRKEAVHRKSIYGVELAISKHTTWRGWPEVNTYC